MNKIGILLTIFFKKLFKATIQDQLDILRPIVLDIVKRIESDPSIIIDGDKRSTAMAMIAQELVSKELIFAKRLVNLAIEIAVVEMKGID